MSAMDIQLFARTAGGDYVPITDNTATIDSGTVSSGTKSGGKKNIIGTLDAQTTFLTPEQYQNGA
jgi:predicted transcriptional regulator